MRAGRSGGALRFAGLAAVLVAAAGWQAGAAAQTPPEGPPGAASSPSTTEPSTTEPPTAEPPGGAAVPHGMRARFAAANTSGDGHLTLAQAQAAGMKGVVRNFDAIDAGHKGFVTLDDIRAFHRAHHAPAAAAPTEGVPQ